MNKIATRRDSEHAKLLQILDFRLAPGFKKIGLIGAVIIFSILIATKFTGDVTLLTKDVLRTLVLLFLLIASLSRESIEDEYIKYQRYRSYVLAVTIAIAYSILIPLIAIVIEYLIINITGDGSLNFHQMSAFEVIFMLIGMQLLFFWTFRRFDLCGIE